MKSSSEMSNGIFHFSTSGLKWGYFTLLEDPPVAEWFCLQNWWTGGARFNTRLRLSTQLFGFFCNFPRNQCKYGLGYFRKPPPQEEHSSRRPRCHMLTIGLNPTTPKPNHFITMRENVLFKNTSLLKIYEKCFSLNESSNISSCMLYSFFLNYTKVT